MTAKFQACIGPSSGSCHLYELGVPLTLCKTAVPARNYRGAISFHNTKLCKRCFNLLQQRIGERASITAELIGVSCIEE